MMNYLLKKTITFIVRHVTTSQELIESLYKRLSRVSCFKTGKSSCISRNSSYRRRKYKNNERWVNILFCNKMQIIRTYLVLFCRRKKKTLLCFIWISMTGKERTSISRLYQSLFPWWNIQPEIPSKHKTAVVPLIAAVVLLLALLIPTMSQCKSSIGLIYVIPIVGWRVEHWHILFLTETMAAISCCMSRQSVFTILLILQTISWASRRYSYMVEYQPITGSQEPWWEDDTTHT